MSTSPQETAASSPLPDRWLDEYGDLLYRYALLRLRDRSEAEDIVQETFLAALRAQQQFTGRGALVSWLMSILKSKISDHFRQRADQFVYSGQADAPDFDSLCFDSRGAWRTGVLPRSYEPLDLPSSEFWHLIRHCLFQLPPAQGDVFVLSVMEGLNTHEICQVLNITASSAWVRLHRARLRLAKCVSEQLTLPASDDTHE